MQKAVKQTVLNNRADAAISSLLKGSSTLLRVSVLECTVSISRDIRVPSSMSLGMLQRRVLSPIFDWDLEMPAGYVFYLSPSCYPSHRRPLSCNDDIVFGRPRRGDFIGRMLSGSPASRAQVVDDDDVCIADFLQSPGHTLYYHHGHSKSPICFKIEAVELSSSPCSVVQLVCGQGAAPPEEPVTVGPSTPGTLGISAYNLVLKWLRSPFASASLKDEAKRALKIEDAAEFDPAYFDVGAARKRLQHSLLHSTKRIPVSSVSNNPFRLGICEVCLRDVKVLKCERCQNAFYCSKECQERDWKNHKVLCAKPIYR